MFSPTCRGWSFPWIQMKVALSRVYLPRVSSAEAMPLLFVATVIDGKPLLKRPPPAFTVKVTSTFATLLLFLPLTRTWSFCGSGLPTTPTWKSVAVCFWIELC